MPPKFPIKTCAICGEEFELKPSKPGLAIHCPDCSSEENHPGSSERTTDREQNAARREAMRNLLYRKDS